MNKPYIQIKAIKLTSDRVVDGRQCYHFEVHRVGLYTPEGTWIKWIKLNENSRRLLQEGKLELPDELSTALGLFDGNAAE